MNPLLPAITHAALLGSALAPPAVGVLEARTGMWFLPFVLAVLVVVVVGLVISERMHRAVAAAGRARRHSRDGGPAR